LHANGSEVNLRPNQNKTHKSMQTRLFLPTVSQADQIFVHRSVVLDTVVHWSLSSFAALLAMVSVFEGQLTRTWFFQNEDKKHVLNLYHDTISGKETKSPWNTRQLKFTVFSNELHSFAGVRSAMLDYQEIRGSLGNSSLLMDSKGHRIFFTIGKLPGYLEIKRSGWTGFEYGCVINDKVIKEVTQGVPENQDLLFQPKILESTFTSDQESEYSIAWYVIHTRRITDGVQTTVHR
jgi:hypothetical protein